MTYDEARAAALNFINDRGSDCVGVIDSEHKFAAAILYLELRKEGLLVSTQTENGPEFRLTPAGVAALRVQ
jgi:hypothetical protein